MKTTTILMYLLSIIGTFLGMFIHIRLMIDTDKPIHFFCVLLWMIICIGLVTIFKHKLVK